MHKAIKKLKLIPKSHVKIHGLIQPEMNIILLQFTIFPGNSPVLHIRRRGGLGIDTVGSLKNGVRHHCLIYHEMSKCYVYLSKNQQLLEERSPPYLLPGIFPWIPLRYDDIRSPGSPHNLCFQLQNTFAPLYAYQCLCHYKK